ncbi:histidine--tRNA ligase [Candidatus Izemoplasma sp. B36]|uniref:histidine--tRNA ligase n=1 Tax=Candidatus Izemoplasma sp. B36 TaxID=3242468 RepID=UPI0035561EAC
MINKIKGTYDILPDETNKWQNLEEVIRNVSKLFNFKEIRTPIFEYSELFHRGVGETTDIVKKETYDFKDRGGRSVTLRPEGTASVVRSAIENKLYASANQPVKLYYHGPMFRYERPQKGRYRQFRQFGAEALGSNSPLIDAEIINYASTVLEALRIKDITVKVNSLGGSESKETYKQKLKEYLKPNITKLCSDCQRRYEENPLRVLDCKVDKGNPILVKAPKPLDYLTDEDRYHFDQVIEALDAIGLNYVVDNSLVRGLDYYTHTVFEIDANLESLGAQKTLVGGGRYNNLVKSLDGPDVPSVGFAFGMERLLIALESVNKIEPKPFIHCFMIALGDSVKNDSLRIVNDLRHGGLVCDYDFFNKNLKGKFKQSDRLNPMFNLIYGSEEKEKGVINVKVVKTGEQKQVPLKDLYQFLVNSIRNITTNSCAGNCSSCDECD